MRKLLTSLPIALLIAALATTGCASRNKKPIPGQTKGGSSSDPSGMVIDSDLAGVGLNPRSSDLLGGDGAGAMGIKGQPNPNSIASVYFAYDQSALASGERAKLGKVAEQMKSDSSLRVVVEGNCDWRGTQEYNLALGERRAKSVVNYLSTMGIDKSRFEVNSKGSMNAVSGADESQMSKDRRADVVPLK